LDKQDEVVILSAAEKELQLELNIKLRKLLRDSDI
jgi:hypothetical protein